MYIEGGYITERIMIHVHSDNIYLNKNMAINIIIVANDRIRSCVCFSIHGRQKNGIDLCLKRERQKGGQGKNEKEKEKENVPVCVRETEHGTKECS